MGNFKDGQPNGQGVWVDPDNNRVLGVWIDGIFQHWICVIYTLKYYKFKYN